MKKLRTLVWTSVLLLMGGCESTAVLEDLLGSTSQAGGAGLSNDTIANGLREALTVGSGRVVNSLGTEDGFFKSAFHIPLPARLQDARGIADKVGLAGPFDELELKMNRAAEQATPKARDLFVAAIREMTFSDVMAIYQGPEDSATQYLQRTTGSRLETQMRPVIDDSLAQVGAVQTFKGLLKSYNALPLVTPIDADVSGHVMGYAQQAIFGQLAKEEAAIRQNPLKRSTELLRRVFGSRSGEQETNVEHAVQVEILKELMQQLDDGKNIDAGVQYRMPTSAYVCPDTAALERETFFQNHPQLIGLSHDLPEPGSFLTTDDFGTPVLATRDKQGKFHAFLNACRHRSVRVAAEASGKRSVFMCPFHHWSYANTGDLITVPNEEHFGPIDKSCNGLIELPAVERDGLLWVHPQANGKLDVDELLGELAPELAGFEMSNHVRVGEKTIDMKLNWKFANDTFGETYHFGKLHKDTLGQLYYGNNLHLKEFGRHHRFVTANRGIDAMRQEPEDQWHISRGTFVLYHLFPNIQLICDPKSVTLIRIYPHASDPGRSITQISFYYVPEVAAQAQAYDEANFDKDNVYNYGVRAGEGGGASLKASLEVFHSTIELEDYVMGQYQQRAAQNGQLKEIVFGRNEPALHHFHQNYREALGQPALVPVET